MASSIKVQNHTKVELDRLQAEILFKFGKKLTQQEIIDILVKIGTEDPSKLVISRSKLNEEKMKRILELSEPWPTKTSPEMLDEMLLGE